MSDKKKILFVDDEPNVLEGQRRSMMRMRRQWEMVFAQGGQEALDLLATEHFDAIVTDMRMPEMDGADLLAKVGRLHSHMIRFVLSGQSDEETILRAVHCSHQFFSKPCDTVQLKESLTKALDLICAIPDRELRSRIAGLNSIPGLPVNVEGLGESLAADNPDMDRITKIAESDLGLSAKLLQLVSSSFFGFFSHISTIRQVVDILGRNVLHRLMEDRGVFTAFSPAMVEEFGLEARFARHLKVGRNADSIAREMGLSAEEAGNAFVAGQLLDIGEIFLISAYPDKAREVFKSCEEDSSDRDEIETRVFGTTHGVVGACLLGLWGLSDDIVETLRDHHRPDGGSGENRILAPVRAAMQRKEMVEA